MDINSLRVFLAVVEMNSMSKAAEVMHLSQPAVSQSVIRIEKLIGAKLFKRNGNSLILTNEGRTMFHHASIALRELDNAYYEINAKNDETVGTIKLQVFTASALVTLLIKDFRQAYPAVKFKMAQTTTSTDYDIRITYAPDGILPDRAHLLLDEEIQIAVPWFHHLAKEKSLSLDQIKTEDYIMMTSGTAMRVLSDEICRKAGFEPKVVFEGDSPATVQQMIKLGMGIAFIPSVSWHNIVDEKVKTLHINDFPCKRTVFITTPPGVRQSLTTKSFINFAIDYFEKLSAERKQETIKNN